MKRRGYEKTMQFCHVNEKYLLILSYEGVIVIT